MGRTVKYYRSSLAEQRCEEAVGKYPPSCTEILANKNRNCRLSFHGIQNRIKAALSFARIHAQMGKNFIGLGLAVR